MKKLSEINILLEENRRYLPQIVIQIEGTVFNGTRNYASALFKKLTFNKK